MKILAVALTATLIATTSCGQNGSLEPPPGNPAATLPSQILDLHDWTLTTPIPDPVTGALEI
jgi:predicted small lipoprotein YifL